MISACSEAHSVSEHRNSACEASDDHGGPTSVFIDEQKQRWRDLLDDPCTISIE